MSFTAAFFFFLVWLIIYVKAHVKYQFQSNLVAANILIGVRAFLNSSADTLPLDSTQLFDSTSLEHIKTFKTERPVNSAAISPIMDHVSHCKSSMYLRNQK